MGRKAGTSKTYTPSGYYSAWNFTKCAGEGSVMWQALPPGSTISASNPTARSLAVGMQSKGTNTPTPHLRTQTSRSEFLSVWKDSNEYLFRQLECHHDNEAYLDLHYYKQMAPHLAWELKWWLSLSAQVLIAKSFSIKSVAADFRSWGFNTSDYKDKIIVDVGAGLRPRGQVFHGAKLVAIEPIANLVMHERAKGFRNQIIKFNIDDPAVVFQLHSVPAEQRICKLEGSADFVFSVNSIDHALEPVRIFATWCV